MPTLLRNSSQTRVAKANRICLFLMIALVPGAAKAQENHALAPASPSGYAELSEQVRELRTLVEQLQRQGGDLQTRVPAGQVSENVGSRPSAAILGQSPALLPAQPQVPSQAPPIQAGDPGSKPAPTEAAGYDFLRGTTVHLLMDG